MTGKGGDILAFLDSAITEREKAAHSVGYDTIVAGDYLIADWFSPADQDSLQTTAERVELDWDGACCPVCEEITCDTGYPLSGIRRDAGDNVPPSKGDRVT